MQIYLLADRELPVVRDAADYPGLVLYPVADNGPAAVLAAIRKIAPASFAYQVSPNGYCGCYFYYETPEEFRERMADRSAHPDVEYADAPEQAEAMWRGQTDAVRSFGRYLSAQAGAGLAVYVVWEQRAGDSEPARAAVPPSYFGGPGFEPLPEDLLLTITSEPCTGEARGWEPAGCRTHEWLRDARACGASGPEPCDA